MTTEEVHFFDKLSETWDAHEIRSTPVKIRQFMDIVSLKDGMSVLDLGTGTGVLLPFLSQAVGPKGRVAAVDVSEGMLSKAIEKYGRLDNVTFKKIDFEEQDLTDRFDVIFLYCVYPHIHFPERTLKKLTADNLNEGGRIIVAFPSDENFINNIHKERKAESDLLPSAPALAKRFRAWGLDSRVRAYSPDLYVVEVRKY